MSFLKYSISLIEKLTSEKQDVLSFYKRKKGAQKWMWEGDNKVSSAVSGHCKMNHPMMDWGRQKQKLGSKKPIEIKKQPHKSRRGAYTLSPTWDALRQGPQPDRGGCGHSARPDKFVWRAITNNWWWHISTKKKIIIRCRPAIEKYQCKLCLYY